MSREKATERIGRSTTNKRNNTSTGVVLLLCLVVVCFTVVLVLFIAKGKDSDIAIISDSDYNRVITPDNIEQVAQQLEKQELVPIGNYEVKMNTEWTFPDGNSPSTSAYVENSIANQQTVYFTIKLSDKPEQDIYKSPYLPVGTHIENLKLDTVLGRGVYDAILTYHLVDAEFRQTSTVSVNIILTIEN